VPFWYQRLVLFRSQNKVKPGYFSIFEETITLVSDLETAGYIISDSTIPDISISLCWAKHLRREGIEPNEIAVVYPHQYLDEPKNAWGQTDLYSLVAALTSKSTD
jgi:hypothetical protein